MAEWYQPRRIKDGPNAGKWHYTVGNSDGDRIYPVGACALDCPGHDTALGAMRHHAEGLAAGEIHERDDEDAQKRCVVCNAWTQHRAIPWGDHLAREIAVCATHDVRAAVLAELLTYYGVA